MFLRGKQLINYDEKQNDFSKILSYKSCRVLIRALILVQVRKQKNCKILWKIDFNIFVNFFQDFWNLSEETTTPTLPVHTMETAVFRSKILCNKMKNQPVVTFKWLILGYVNKARVTN